MWLVVFILFLVMLYAEEKVKNKFLSSFLITVSYFSMVAIFVYKPVWMENLL